MAGSLNHIVTDEGTFTADLLDGVTGDAVEALEECYNVIGELAGWDVEKINAVLDKLNYPTLDAEKMERHDRGY